jgi:hypothetical protein
MEGYPIKFDTDDLKPLSEVGNRELTTWRGVKNKSLRGRHVTDGTMIIDKKHVEGTGFFEKLCDRKSDEKIENDRIKQVVSEVKDKEQWVGKVRGQMSNPPGMDVSPRWIALVGYRNYKHHCICDAMRIKMVRKLVGETPKLKVGESERLSWWKYGVPVAITASFNFYSPDVQ